MRKSTSVDFIKRKVSFLYTCAKLQVEIIDAASFEQFTNENYTSEKIGLQNEDVIPGLLLLRLNESGYSRLIAVIDDNDDCLHMYCYGVELDDEQRDAVHEFIDEDKELVCKKSSVEFFFENDEEATVVTEFLMVFAKQEGKKNLTADIDVKFGKWVLLQQAALEERILQENEKRRQEEQRAYEQQQQREEQQRLEDALKQQQAEEQQRLADAFRQQEEQRNISVQSTLLPEGQESDSGLSDAESEEDIFEADIYQVDTDPVIRAKINFQADAQEITLHLNAFVSHINDTIKGESPILPVTLEKLMEYTSHYIRTLDTLSRFYSSEDREDKLGSLDAISITMLEELIQHINCLNAILEYFHSEEYIKNTIDCELADLEDAAQEFISKKLGVKYKRKKAQQKGLSSFILEMDSRATQLLFGLFTCIASFVKRYSFYGERTCQEKEYLEFINKLDQLLTQIDFLVGQKKGSLRNIFIADIMSVKLKGQARLIFNMFVSLDQIGSDFLRLSRSLRLDEENRVKEKVKYYISRGFFANQEKAINEIAQKSLQYFLRRLSPLRWFDELVLTLIITLQEQHIMSHYNFAKQLDEKYRLGLVELKSKHQAGDVTSSLQALVDADVPVIYQGGQDSQRAGLYFIIPEVDPEEVQPYAIMLLNTDANCYEVVSFGYAMQQQDQEIVVEFMKKHGLEVSGILSYAESVRFDLKTLLQNIIDEYTTDEGLTLNAMRLFSKGILAANADSQLNRALKSVEKVNLEKERIIAAGDDNLLASEQRIKILQEENKELKAKIVSKNRNSLKLMDGETLAAQQDLLKLIKEQKDEIEKLHDTLHHVRQVAFSEEGEKEELESKIQEVEANYKKLNEKYLEQEHELRVAQEKHGRIRELEDKQQELEAHYKDDVSRYEQQSRELQQRLKKETQIEGNTRSLAEEFVLEGEVAQDVQPTQLDESRKICMLDGIFKFSIDCNLFFKELYNQFVEKQLQKQIDALNLERHERTVQTFHGLGPFQRLRNKDVLIDDKDIEKKRLSYDKVRERFSQTSCETSEKFSPLILRMLALIESFKFEGSFNIAEYNSVSEEVIRFLGFQVDSIIDILRDFFPKYVNATKRIKSSLIKSGIEVLQEQNPVVRDVLISIEGSLISDEDIDTPTNPICDAELLEASEVIFSKSEKLNKLLQNTQEDHSLEMKEDISTIIKKLQLTLRDIQWTQKINVMTKEQFQQNFELELKRTLISVDEYYSARSKERLKDFSGDSDNAGSIASLAKSEAQMSLGNKASSSDNTVKPYSIAYDAFCQMLLCWYAVLAQFDGDGATVEQRQMLMLLIHQYVETKELEMSAYCHQNYVDFERRSKEILKDRSFGDLSDVELQEVANLQKEASSATKKIKTHNSQFLTGELSMFVPCAKNYLDKHDPDFLGGLQKKMQSA